MILQGRAQEVIGKMTAEGKVTILSAEFTAKFENDIAIAMGPVKEEFRKKERNSRAHIADIEKTTVEE